MLQSWLGGLVSKRLSTVVRSVAQRPAKFNGKDGEEFERLKDMVSIKSNEI